MSAPDPFGFAAAINWDVVDKLTPAQLDRVNGMFESSTDDDKGTQSK